MRTLTALFDHKQDAQDARQQLLQAGFDKENIQISDAGETAASGASGGADKGFLQGIKDFFLPQEDHHAYSDAVQRGGVLLTVKAPDGQEQRAIQILDASRAVDFDERQQQWRASGSPGGPASTKGKTTDTGDTRIPIAEERLRVGKREVDRGSVRVRSYVTEEPVQEQVTLRQEHVNVERRPIGEKAPGDAAGLFEERSFEVSERGEEAVVAKDTVVTDELHVSKDVEERTEDVKDTVRRTQVEVDDQRKAGAPRGPASPPRGV